MPKISSESRHFWKSSIHRLRVELERLHEAVDAERRQECFQQIEAIEATLRVLRASVRNNMADTHQS